MTAIASWKLEHGVSIGLLEYMLGARSLGSAILAPGKFKMMNAWLPLIIAVWCLSPLGGQAALRIVSAPLASNITHTEIRYLDTLQSEPILQSGGDDANFWVTAVSTAFIEALASPVTSKNGSQDVYNNINLPMLEALTGTPNATGWFDLAEGGYHVLNAAILGIPFSDAPLGANSSFSIESSYFNLECDLNITNISSIEDLWWQEEGVFNNTSGQGVRRTNMRIRDDTAMLGSSLTHLYNSSQPRRVGVQSVSEFSGNDTHYALTEAWCDLTTTYIEAQVQCVNTGFNCSVPFMRRSTRPHLPSTATALDSITYPPSDPGFLNNRLTAMDFYHTFMNAVPPNFHDTLSPIEQFFLTPDNPFDNQQNIGGAPPPPIGSIGKELFERRFTQLLNTYWLTFVAPSAVTGSFDPTRQFNKNYTKDYTTYVAASSPATVEVSYTALKFHWAWAGCLISISILLIFAGIATAVLEAQRKGPSVLDTFLGSQRDNPYAHVERGNAMEDGVSAIRRARHALVRLGDVSPDEPVGHLAIATPSELQPVATLRSRRQYR